MTGRVGRFLLFLGLVLMVVFFASDLAQSPRFDLFFFGLGAVVVGILLIRSDRKPRPPSRRFRLLRMLFGRKDDRDNQQQEREARG
jgi:hypothetical protein